METNIKIGLISSLFTALLMSIGIIIIINQYNQSETSKPVEQPPGIIFDDQRINRIYIIKDTRRNLQWDVVILGQAIVIIPGTEKPIKTNLDKN